MQLNDAIYRIYEGGEVAHDSWIYRRRGKQLVMRYRYDPTSPWQRALLTPAELDSEKWEEYVKTKPTQTPTNDEYIEIAISALERLRDSLK